MIQAIFFDLGNVLLHFDHTILTRRLADISVDTATGAAYEHKLPSLIKRYESGEIDTDGFFQEFVELNSSVRLPEKEELSQLWSDIFWKNEELVQFLSQISDSVRLIMVSNTNPLHIQFARQQFPDVFEPFDDFVFSYEILSLKPDKEMFLEALKRADVTAEDCLYFDDLAVNISSASQLGINAYQYVSVKGVKDILKIYDILPPVFTVNI